jgi:hypothetical protein
MMQGEFSRLQIDLPKNFLCLIAVLGFGVVLVGAGFDGMVPNPIIEGSGVAMIFTDVFVWVKQRKNSRHKRKH